jgi:predicted Zn-dependent protease
LPSVPRLDRALDLADRGMLDDALRVLEDAVREEPASTRARIARARILLGMGRPEAAAVDLRAALFASSDDPMARYLYAAALFDLGRRRQGLAQLRGALRAVEAMNDDAVIGDGHATVGTLRRASRELLRQYE